MRTQRASSNVNRFTHLTAGQEATPLRGERISLFLFLSIRGYMTEDVILSALSVSDHPRATKADPKDFFDNSFLTELEESGFIKELYAKR